MPMETRACHTSSANPDAETEASTAAESGEETAEDVLMEMPEEATPLCNTLRQGVTKRWEGHILPSL